MNLHLVLDDGERKILSEIVEVDNNVITIEFLGEFHQDQFVPGIIQKPKTIAKVRGITESELDIILCKNDTQAFELGKSVLYNAPIYVNVDMLFSNHAAIFGNSGSGKSMGVSRILQSIFYNPKNIALNSTLFIFDAHGEYNVALKNIGVINPHYRIKTYGYKMEHGDNRIRIPIWLLDIEDIGDLLGATEYEQLAIIERAMNFLAVLSRKDEMADKYKNHLIAKAIQSLMYSNQSLSKIRSQIFEIVSICPTKEFNLGAIIPGVGYTRLFKNCFDIGKTGVFSEGILMGEYIAKYMDEELEQQLITKISKCNLKDLEDALNFVIISEDMTNNNIFYNHAMELKLKLHNLVRSGFSKIFDYPEYIDLNGFISRLILDVDGKKSNIINVNLEGLNSNMSFFIANKFSKLLFEFVSLLQNRGSMPVHIILEEAHRLLKKDLKISMNENIFERIAKEGRKYGILLILVSQRPTELSENVLAQCTSFLLFRTSHPRDLEYMKKAIPNINTDIIEKQRSIQPGYCVGLGRAFKIPIIIQLDKPDPKPESSNVPVYKIWSGQ